MKYYHIWFQTKHNKYILIDAIDIKIHELFKQIAEEKNICYFTSGSLPDHVHLLIGLENQKDLSWAVKMLKGISARRVFQEFRLLKQGFRVNNLWARKYGVKEVDPEALGATAKYIDNQKKDLYVV